MTSDSIEKIVATFLATPVPGTDTPEWPDWVKQAASISSFAAPHFIRALELGDFNAQYSSLLWLRQHGYDAWAEGYGPDMVYKWSEIGDEREVVVKPKMLSPKFPRGFDGSV